MMTDGPSTETRQYKIRESNTRIKFPSWDNIINMKYRVEKRPRLLHQLYFPISPLQFTDAEQDNGQLITLQPVNSFLAAASVHNKSNAIY